ncbi:MAG: hypothetical protein AAFR38_12470 [Planctomycetota bacterium]
MPMHYNPLVFGTERASGPSNPVWGKNGGIASNGTGAGQGAANGAVPVGTGPRAWQSPMMRSAAWARAPAHSPVHKPKRRPKRARSRRAAISLPPGAELLLAAEAMQLRDPAALHAWKPLSAAAWKREAQNYLFTKLFGQTGTTKQDVGEKAIDFGVGHAEGAAGGAFAEAVVGGGGRTAWNVASAGAAGTLEALTIPAQLNPIGAAVGGTFGMAKTGRSLYSTGMHKKRLAELSEKVSQNQIACTCGHRGGSDNDHGRTCHATLAYLRRQKTNKMWKKGGEMVPFLGGTIVLFYRAGRWVYKLQHGQLGVERGAQARHMYNAVGSCPLATAILAELLGNYNDPKRWAYAIAVSKWDHGEDLIADKLATT